MMASASLMVAATKAKMTPEMKAINTSRKPYLDRDPTRVNRDCSQEGEPRDMELAEGDTVVKLQSSSVEGMPT